MIILKEQNTSQTFKFIPRYYTGVVLKMQNEMSKQSISMAVQCDQVGYYHQITDIFDLKEGNFYSLAIYDGDNNVVYRDRVFCTNQEVGDYTVNKDEYEEHTTNNEFIIYE